MRRRKQEERLQEVCQDGRRRFAAKRLVSTWRAVGRGQLHTAWARRETPDWQTPLLLPLATISSNSGWGFHVVEDLSQAVGFIL